MSIIEQIKAQIEGWLREYAEDSQFELGERHGYKRLLSFLSALESEHLADARKTSPKDLEEAAKHYASVTDPEAHGFDFIREIFIAGAEWNREQMMSKAVEGFIFQSADYYPKQLIAGYDGELGMGDKVRVIVLPKEDSHE